MEIPKYQSTLPTPIPVQSKILSRYINPVYRFFDWLYGSEYNPLYRSGTLAVGFLIILLLTGLYLSFFYSVSDPYGSIEQIQGQIYLGRWIRALHRYSTVAAVIAIIFHILQLLVQGKSYGPRTLAWVSGVFLTVMFFISAWSGYVMVWDLFGQKVAITGAKMLAVIPFLHDLLVAAFDGTADLPPGFFFMNLFLHVALPVMLIMFLWVHTAKLSRSVWLPTRVILIGASIALILLSLLWSAPLLPKAELLLIVGQIPIDLTTGFWIPLQEMIGIVPTWGLMILVTLLLCFIPWWWRPKAEEKRGHSTVDPIACTGCLQCTRDCPYEAIKMVPRSDGKRMIAEIIPGNCVSCGICAASCADFAIGPPGRTGVDQRERVREYCLELRSKGIEIDKVIVACANNYKLSEMLVEYTSDAQRTALYAVECCGCLHSEVIEEILKVSKGIALIGCPARNCFNRDGGDLLAERIFEKRVPFLDRSIDRGRVLITKFSEAEVDKMYTSLNDLDNRLSNQAATKSNNYSVWPQRFRAVVASAVILFLCGYIAQYPSGVDSVNAIIRVAGLLPSSISEGCHKPTESELAGIPLHMRPKEICSRLPLRYRLQIMLGHELVLDREIEDLKGRTDRPLFLDIDLPIPPGDHNLNISMQPSKGEKIGCSGSFILSSGRILLVHYRADEARLVCGEG